MPRDINDLPEMQNSECKDVRTLDKLCDGTNDTLEDEHMWLVPFVPGRPNFLFVIFDEPITVRRHGPTSSVSCRRA